MKKEITLLAAQYYKARNYSPQRADIPKKFKVRDVKDEINRMIKVAQDRALNKPFVFRKATKDTRVLILLKHLQVAASFLPSSGYSMGEMKQIHVAGVTISKHDNREWYSGKKAWRPTHGEITLRLTIKEAYNTRIIGGVVTIKKEKINKNLQAVSWFVRAANKGSELKRIEGYLILPQNYHFTASTLQEARGKAKEFANNSKEEDRKTKLLAKCGKRKDSVTWVTLEDSLKGGNCRIGTDNFAEKLNFNKESEGAVRADFLLKIAERYKLQSYALRAIKAAKMRYVGL